MRAELLVVDGQSKGLCVLLRDDLIVGRDVGCGLQLFDDAVSREHFEIVSGEDGFRLRDLQSTNGTAVNGERVEQCPLYHQDRIACGGSAMLFYCPASPSPNRTSVDLDSGFQEVEGPEEQLSESSITRLLGEAARDAAAQQKGVDELIEVYRVSRQLAECGSIDEVQQVLLLGIEALVETHERLVIFRYDAQGEHVSPVVHRKATSDRPRTKIQVNRKLVERCCRERASLAQRLPGGGTALVSPLPGRRQVRGAVYLELAQGGAEPLGPLRRLAALCHSAGGVIERCELASEVQHQNRRLRSWGELLEQTVAERTRELSILYGLARETSHVLDFDQLAARILQGIAQVTQFSMAGMVVSHGGRTRIKLEAGSALGKELLERFHGLIRGALGRTPPRSHARIVKMLEAECSLEGYSCVLGLPLYYGEREEIGLLLLCTQPEDPFSEQDLQFLETVRRLAETATEQLLRALEQQDATLQSLLAGLSEGIVVAGRDDGRVLVANALGEEFLALAGQRAADGRIESVGEHAFAALVAQVDERRAATLELSGPEGRVFSLTVSGGGTIDPRHSVTLVLREITEEQRARRRLAQAEKLASLGELISGIAHELNNPLTSVMGYAQLLMMEGGDQASEELACIYQEASRCGTIVRKLLSLARAGAQEQMLLDPNHVAGAAADIKAYELKTHNIELALELAPELPPVLADQHQLTQALLNLLNNSAQAILSLRDSGSIALRTRLERGEVVIEVADDGPGIPQELQPRVFDPFFTTKEVGQGTGLGLSLVHAIVSDHEGMVTLASRSGEGTTVTIRLPARIEQPHEEPVTPAAPGARALRVLIVDDEPPIRVLIARVLETRGHRWDEAESGEQALELALHNDYDCLISDYRMPGMDGPALHRALLAQRPELARRTVFITGDLGAAGTQTYLEECGCQYLSKPFNLQRLSEVISAVAGDRD